ncbi:hypothetical protein K461DRAFT_311460 [Myriangium duriaei CBS 260.36]|uniref:Cysteine protease n=1 Tax=Myriangium duriaei CBS 260.36 TaxID=1168546 RepID=A0A9P4J5G6_9PEZI|nr:hypothetical protein K461DRAFT_311460 [Myriangium duriaei CBS 260.36]
MNANDISRYSKRFVQYFWDPLPTNDSADPIWCLGQRYDSHPVRPSRDTSGSPATSPPSSLPSAADSAISTSKEKDADTSSIDIVERTESAERDEALSKGWPGAFVDDVDTRIWLTYRSGFAAIAKSTDPAASGAMSFATRLKQLGNQSGFTSDTGWGCMIRSGQSLLANTLAMLELGREWRRGEQLENERKLLALFADDNSAPFSIHRFVDHGASACGKHPGEWFGPSATARCIQQLTNSHHPANLRVYVRPDDSDIYEDSFLATAQSSSQFQPTLILLGTRLGIDRINPVYHAALSRILTCPQSVGIAGGRPSSSHYFVGVQGNSYFYLDPHYTRSFLHKNPTLEDVASCHTRRLRKIDVAEMDPSMLLGFLIRSEAEWRDWRAWISDSEAVRGADGRGKLVVHVHDREPSFGDEARGVRADALDEVVSCEESDDETVVS